ncbi:hypothetical protein C7H84_19130 [Burkholderia sp. Nafp2/4-1b]|uniref:phage holin family protein n=1 Tax=Burkholderia sp. Nafp2/4-1b TaxID=2116686 RepID=UPI000EF8B4BB|nr:phage holin family protein [Burkholderia sp. Nafp2/4-1b]RKU01960.1 hypothetical protein C7H84_19130 [Burkholderia sp. Nafp2/4-1b]
MTQIAVLIALAAHGVLIVRVLTYRRRGARHRAGVAWSAWLLIALTCGGAIELLGGKLGIFQAMQSVMLAVMVITARGNIARLLGGSR